MKRYDLFGSRNGYVVPAHNPVESHNGEWVPAEVAQALYDALVVARKSLATYGEHPIIEDRIKSALSLADGDEQ
jgi:hypothetical protein